MTRGDLNLVQLREWYAEGKLTWDAFQTCVEVNLNAQAEGWGQEIIPAKELPRWARNHLTLAEAA